MLISPEELKLPGYMKKEVLQKCNMTYTETTSLEEAVPQLDVLYMTRVQRERFDDLETYERLKDTYILTPDKLLSATADMSILHPLPRVNEISVAVDDDPRACYFKQVLNGKYMRMALILKLLSDESKAYSVPEEECVSGEMKCGNPRCITSVEQELVHKFKFVDGVYRCIYCEREAE